MESGAYGGLLKSKGVDLEEGSGPNYLLNGCMCGIQAGDNFLGKIKKSINLGTNPRRLLRNCKNRDLYNWEVLGEFSKGNFNENIVQNVKKYLGKLEFESLDELLEGGEDYETNYLNYVGMEGEESFGVERTSSEILFDKVYENENLNEIDGRGTVDFFVSKINNNRTKDCFVRHVLRGETLEEIGNDYSISREIVRQIIVGSLGKFENKYGRKFSEGRI